MEIWEKNSPQTTAIRLSYKMAGYDKLTSERVARLAQSMGCDPYEVCAIAGMNRRGDVERCWQLGEWPLSVALHFANLENMMRTLKLHTAQMPTPQSIAIAKLVARAESAETATNPTQLSDKTGQLPEPSVTA